MRHRVLRDILAALLFGTLTGAVGCDSNSSDEQGSEGSSSNRAKGALQEDEGGGSAGDQGADGGASEVEFGEPGWNLELTGPVSVRAEGPIVTRRHAGTDARQLALQQSPMGGQKDGGQIAFTLSGFSKTEAKTYGAVKAQANFGSANLACEHPAETDAGERSKLRVELEYVSPAAIKGSFQGKLRCRSTEDEDGREPMFVEVSGEFSDPG